MDTPNGNLRNYNKTGKGGWMANPFLTEDTDYFKKNRILVKMKSLNDNDSSRTSVLKIASNWRKNWA
jgi:hypothetical protein